MTMAMSRAQRAHIVNDSKDRAKRCDAMAEIETSRGNHGMAATDRQHAAGFRAKAAKAARG
jgi:hypothetical protein